MNTGTDIVSKLGAGQRHCSEDICRFWEMTFSSLKSGQNSESLGNINTQCFQNRKHCQKFYLRIKVSSTNSSMDWACSFALFIIRPDWCGLVNWLLIGLFEDKEAHLCNLSRHLWWSFFSLGPFHAGLQRRGYCEWDQSPALSGIRFLMYLTGFLGREALSNPLWHLPHPFSALYLSTELWSSLMDDFQTIKLQDFFSMWV